MTDGRTGDPTFSSEDELVEERQREAKEAAKIIGIDSLIFLTHRSRQLGKSKHTTAEMTKLLEKLKPDIVYLPFFMDNHPDHIATNKIFVSACKNRVYKFKCCAYEVWSMMMANYVVDISKYIHKKVNAIEQHKTQLKVINYPEKIIGLNAYRSITVPNATHAEAFFCCNPEKYAKLFKSK